MPEAFTEDGPRALRATRFLSVWGKLANAAEVRPGFLRLPPVDHGQLPMETGLQARTVGVREVLKIKFECL